MTESNDRIDLEDSHTPESPRVRRIKLPHTTSEVVKSLMYSDHVLAPVRDLIGPDLRLHTTKLNMKSAGYGAPIEWHQDFAFYPHTNDDVLAVGVIIDDMGSENGPLMVFPGSHKGPIHDHHVDGVFAGAMDLEACGFDIADAVELKAPAGSISIHHGRTVHGLGIERVDFRPPAAVLRNHGGGCLSGYGGHDRGSTESRTTIRGCFAASPRWSRGWRTCRCEFPQPQPAKTDRSTKSSPA